MKDILKEMCGIHKLDILREMCEMHIFKNFKHFYKHFIYFNIIVITNMSHTYIIYMLTDFFKKCVTYTYSDKLIYFKIFII